MSIVLELPNEIEQSLAKSWGTPDNGLPRRILEAVAAEGYRQGVLSRTEVRRLLQLSFYETETFLKEHDCPLHYTAEDLEVDARNLERLESTPEYWIDIAKAALSEGDYLEARRLINRGAELFPEDAHVQKVAILLAPPKVLPRDPSAKKTESGWPQNSQWLKAHREEYLGKWVALRHGKLLANADSVVALQQQVDDLQTCLVTQVF